MIRIPFFSKYKEGFQGQVDFLIFIAWFHRKEGQQQYS